MVMLFELGCLSLIAAAFVSGGGSKPQRAHLLVRTLALLHEIVTEQAMAHFDWATDGGESVLLPRLIDLLSACADSPPINDQRALLRFEFSPTGHPVPYANFLLPLSSLVKSS